MLKALVLNMARRVYLEIENSSTQHRPSSFRNLNKLILNILSYLQMFYSSHRYRSNASESLSSTSLHCQLTTIFAFADDTAILSKQTVPEVADRSLQSHLYSSVPWLQQITYYD